MGKSKSRSSESKHSRRSSDGEKVVEIFQQLPDGSYQPVYVSKEKARLIKAEQDRLRRAPKATDEDQFKIAEALGLGFTSDDRPNCVPGYQYRGADGKCKARPVDAFGNSGAAQMTPVIFNDGYSTKALTTNNKVVDLGGGLGGMSTFGNVGGPTQFSAGAAPGWGGLATALGRNTYSGFGNVPDPQDGRLKSWKTNSGVWQPYEAKWLNLNDCKPQDGLRTPNQGCISLQGAFEEGFTKNILADGTVVGQPPKVSFQDMTSPPYTFRPFGQPAGKWNTAPNGYRPTSWETNNNGGKAWGT